MSKIVKISESNIIKISEIIYESEIDLSIYGDDDFVEVFIINFRKWLINNVGEETKNFPLSYVINKHLKAFCDSIDGLTLDCTNYGRYGKPMVSVGQFLVKSGLENIGKTPISFKHTEKFKKLWDTAIKKANIPDFVSYELIEDKPFDVRFIITYNLEDYLRSKQKFSYNNKISDISRRVEQFLTKYGGVKFGKIQFGEVDFKTYIQIENMDMWTNKTFATNIKNQIKMDPKVSRDVHSLRFYFDKYDNKPSVKIAYKDSGRWQSRDESVTLLQDILIKAGFNIYNLSIDN